MTVDVTIEKINEVHVRVRAEPSIMMDCSDHFTFEVPGAKFMPSFKNKQWDGRIRLLNYMTGIIYNGLTAHIADFCKKLNYSIRIDQDLVPNFSSFDSNAGYNLATKFDSSLEPYYYQNEAISHSSMYDRALFLSPTASGKSLIIYLLARNLVESKRCRVLIIVPTISLVSQMSTDFINYNNGQLLDIHKITAGVDKHVKSDYVISTWQSIQNLPNEWFAKFGAVIGDEAHMFKAKSLIKIMENTPDIKFRYGFTGSLDDSQTHRLVLEGIFGPIKRITKTRDLIDEGKLADFNIKAIVLKHSNVSCKLVSKMKFQDEIDWIISNSDRNEFIKKLAHTIQGNTLILYRFVEKHGNILLPLLQKSNEHQVHYVHGGIIAEERENIRRICETSYENIILASYGVFSQGINIKRLNNVIFASPSKSKIRNLQSIGRVLRIGNGKKKATLYDIVDDLQWKSHKNFAIKHFIDRVKIYNDEEFDYRIYNVPMKG